VRVIRTRWDGMLIFIPLCFYLMSVCWSRTTANNTFLDLSFCSKTQEIPKIRFPKSPVKLVDEASKLVMSTEVGVRLALALHLIKVLVKPGNDNSGLFYVDKKTVDIAFMLMNDEEEVVRRASLPFMGVVLERIFVGATWKHSRTLEFFNGWFMKMAKAVVDWPLLCRELISIINNASSFISGDVVQKDAYVALCYLAGTGDRVVQIDAMMAAVRLMKLNPWFEWGKSSELLFKMCEDDPMIILCTMEEMAEAGIEFSTDACKKAIEFLRGDTDKQVQFWLEMLGIERENVVEGTGGPKGTLITRLRGRMCGKLISCARRLRRSTRASRSDT